MSVVELQEGMTDLLPCNEQCGGEYEKYRFGQTDKEVVIYVPLEAGTTAKQVSVEFTSTTLSISTRGEQPVLSGTLFKLIKVSESTWCIQDRKELVVTLTKTNLKYEEWWPHVVLSERQIDMKTLRPPEVHVSELDEGAQATVARMMLEQRQKMSGMPLGAPPL